MPSGSSFIRRHMPPMLRQENGPRFTGGRQPEDVGAFDSICRARKCRRAHSTPLYEAMGHVLPVVLTGVCVSGRKLRIELGGPVLEAEWSRGLRGGSEGEQAGRHQGERNRPTESRGASPFLEFALRPTLATASFFATR